MERTRSLVLVGPMAAGKTSVGKRVAAALRLPFVDTDALITAKHGAITELFASVGEKEFREIEASEVLSALADGAQTAKVIALGGGSVLNAQVRSALGAFDVVLLMTTLEDVLANAKTDQRPLLAERPERWQEILDERLPLYHAVSDVTFDSGGRPKELVADQVIDWVRRRHEQ